MRFIPISERNYSSILEEYPVSLNYVGTIQKAKRTKFTWKGLTLMKDPMSLTTYQELIQELKPKTILEFGSYDGGSALWMSDLCKSLEIKCKIYTFDIRKISVDNITSITVDNYKFKDYVQNNLDLFNSLEHPVLVIEDSHENISEILSEVDLFLNTGDYIIVEDTIYRSNYDQMLEFLKSKKYLVDTYYCDFWGNNNSWNFNSYLIKD